MPLLKNYVQFLVVSLGWLMLPHSRQQAQIMVGLGYPTFRVKILSERTKRMNEQYKNKMTVFIGGSAQNLQNTQFGPAVFLKKKYIFFLN